MTGNALLCRVEPQASFRVDLTPALDWSRDVNNRSLPGRVRRSLLHEPRIGARCGVGAEFRIGADTLIVCSVHLEDKFGGVQGRSRHFQSALRSIGARVGAETPSIVMAGDFNTFDTRLARLWTRDTDATALGRPRDVSEAEWWKRALLPNSRFADPFESDDWTFQITPFFRAKLDWIALRDLNTRAFGVAPFASSDHSAIWADVELAASRPCAERVDHL